jgi:hypothetical protein
MLAQGTRNVTRTSISGSFLFAPLGAREGGGGGLGGGVSCLSPVAPRRTVRECDLGISPYWISKDLEFYVCLTVTFSHDTCR